MKRALRLYVTGGSAASRRAVESLRSILRAQPGDPYELEVVDVLRHPDLAAGDRILATPTLIGRGEPSCRIVGELCDAELLLPALDSRGP